MVLPAGNEPRSALRANIRIGAGSRDPWIVHGTVEGTKKDKKGPGKDRTNSVKRERTIK